jgi:hypothetical protein
MTGTSMSGGGNDRTGDLEPSLLRSGVRGYRSVRSQWSGYDDALLSATMLYV